MTCLTPRHQGIVVIPNLFELIPIAVCVTATGYMLWLTAHLQQRLRQAHLDESVTEVEMQHRDREIARLNQDLDIEKEKCRLKEALLVELVKKITDSVNSGDEDSP